MINIINSSLLQYLKNTKEYSHTCISSSCRIRGRTVLTVLTVPEPFRVVCRCAGVQVLCCCVVVVLMLGRTYVQVNEDYLKGLHTTGLQAQSGGGGGSSSYPLIPYIYTWTHSSSPSYRKSNFVHTQTWIYLFFQLGVMMFANTILAVVFSFFFLSSMLMACGPTGGCGNV